MIQAEDKICAWNKCRCKAMRQGSSRCGKFWQEAWTRSTIKTLVRTHDTRAFKAFIFQFSSGCCNITGTTCLLDPKWHKIKKHRHPKLRRFVPQCFFVLGIVLQHANESGSTCRVASAIDRHTIQGFAVSWLPCQQTNNKRLLRSQHHNGQIEWFWNTDDLNSWTTRHQTKTTQMLMRSTTALDVL